MTSSVTSNRCATAPVDNNKDDYNSNTLPKTLCNRIKGVMLLSSATPAGNRSHKSSLNKERAKETARGKSCGGVWSVVSLGVIMHVVYVVAMFDIHFRSPLVHGMTPHVSIATPPAERVVLFVGDGLRADKTFEYDVNGLDSTDKPSRAPFLRSIIETKGSWGISHTRVPTESRPCHVAMCAGFYEDVSAVTKGWKSNPVEFDSVFNESHWSYGFGSPDIVPMFVPSTTFPNMNSFTYSSHQEDFGKDASHLDKWVYDKLTELLQNASTDSVLWDNVRHPRNIFFLHLLALDTLGHAHKPSSREYLQQISFVDSLVEEVYNIFEDLFPKNTTFYLFTADHGMSDKGSHGDGESVNTETPYVVWGSGARGPHSSDSSGCIPTPETWKLNSFCRRDVNQADLTALMASVIGIPFPMNSVGVVPLSVLDLSESQKTEALHNNALEIIEQYRMKRDLKLKKSLFFTEFPPLDGTQAENILSAIENALARGDNGVAQEYCARLITLGLEGLHYMHTYDHMLLTTVVVCGYISWTAFLTTFLILNHGVPSLISKNSLASPEIYKQQVKKSSILHIPHILSIFGFLALSTYFFLQSSPMLYYIYSSFPFFFGSYIIRNKTAAMQVLQKRLNMSSSSWLHCLYNVLHATLYVLRAAAMSGVLALCYYDRRILSCLMCLIGMWPWARHFMLLFFIKFPAFAPPSVSISNPETPETQPANSIGVTTIDAADAQAISPIFSTVWTTVCFFAALFPFLSDNLNESTPLLALGTLGIITAAALSLRNYRIFPGRSEVTVGVSRTRYTVNTTQASSNWVFQNIFFLSFKVFIVLIAFWLTVDTSKHLYLRTGLPKLNQFLAWAILALTFVGPATRSRHYFDILCDTFLSFAPSFILLSLSYEVAFYCVIGTLVILWVIIEAKVRHRAVTAPLIPPGLLGQEDVSRTQESPLGLADVRTALFYAIFCHLAFFGVGNIASMSSFEVASTYRFVTVFSPFCMSFLIIYKALVPILLVSFGYGVICKIANVSHAAGILIGSALTEVMTLAFFLSIKTTGSWRDIGMSISHFGLASALTVFQVALLVISRYYLSRPPPSHHNKRR
ncbi:phosphatidylinositol glycan [Pelomyxa schiedti]|nr:phosphatidylinositol glycan [Pelomyxa schiedti]